MTKLVKWKETILEFTSRYEIYVMAAVRFVIGFAAFRLIIQNTGYMDILSRYPVAVLLALVCCFLPAGLMMFVGAVLILLELYALSMILCLLVGAVFLLMLCAYLRLSSRKGLYAMLTPILSVWGIPYAMPVTTGLRGEPYAVISVICGEVTYFMLRNALADPSLYASAEDSGTSAAITQIVTELILDREMYLYLIAFAAAAVVTYCFCKLSFTQSHLVAAAIGLALEFAVIAIGEMWLDNGAVIPCVLIGCLVSCGILLVVWFFTYNLDYSREEKVQFEDDDYYYYVKAIPKRKSSDGAGQTARQEAARQEAARQEAARQEAARQEVARQEAARQEAARRDAAYRDVMLEDAMLQEALRQEAPQRKVTEETPKKKSSNQRAAKKE